MKVINTAHIRQVLNIRLYLAHFLMHPVNVSQDRFSPANIFTVQFHNYPKHAVSRRMLRPQIQNQGIAFSLAKF